MKSLSIFINEELEREDLQNTYELVTLTRRENVKCAKLSREEFIKLMGEDLKKAAKDYNDVNKKLSDELEKQKKEKFIQSITDYAEKKYKRASSKEKYIQTAIDNYKSNPFTNKLTFVDFNVEPYNNGINQDCILNPNGSDEKLGKCFDAIQNNKYWKRATGWAIKYETVKNGVRSCFRPYVDLLGDESLKKEMEHDKETLANAITDFYSNSNYWGD